MSRRWLPDIPGLSKFSEINVRTYVEIDGKPGVWFFSLDAPNTLAVWAAQKLYHLPYFYGDINMRSEADGTTDYTLVRDYDWLSICRATYRPMGNVRHATPDTLEHFLTEHYCLYAHNGDGQLFRTDVHHAPWPLQDVNAVFGTNNLLERCGESTHPATRNTSCTATISHTLRKAC